MATRISFTVPSRFDDDLAELSQHDLALMLRDALYEFVAHRADGDAARYVEKRYPLTDPNDDGYICAYPAGVTRFRKVTQVARRCRYAKALHDFLDLTIEHERDVDGDDDEVLTARRRFAAEDVADSLRDLLVMPTAESCAQHYPAPCPASCPNRGDRYSSAQIGDMHGGTFTGGDEQ
jgi:hypothetical protein